MKARDTVKKILSDSGVTNATLAHRLNITIAACWELTGKEKKGGDMSTKTLVPVLNALDYKLVAIPRDERVPKNGYVIE